MQGNNLVYNQWMSYAYDSSGRPISFIESAGFSNDTLFKYKYYYGFKGLETYEEIMQYQNGEWQLIGGFRIDSATLFQNNPAQPLHISLSKYLQGSWKKQKAYSYTYIQNKLKSRAIYVFEGNTWELQATDSVEYDIIPSLGSTLITYLMINGSLTPNRKLTGIKDTIEYSLTQINTYSEYEWKANNWEYLRSKHTVFPDNWGSQITESYLVKNGNLFRETRSQKWVDSNSLLIVRTSLDYPNFEQEWQRKNIYTYTHEFTDNKLYSLTSYYRSDTLIEPQFQYKLFFDTPLQGLRKEGKKYSIQVYPNPFQENLNILGLTNIPCKVSLYNSIGQEVMPETEYVGDPINTNDVPNGMYVLKITFENGSGQYYTLIK